MYGTWNRRGDFAHSSDSTFLYGNGFLLCKELQTSASVVSGDTIVSETFGELCGEREYRDHREGYPADKYRELKADGILCNPGNLPFS